jgi:hypothetical protein
VDPFLLSKKRVWYLGSSCHKNQKKCECAFSIQVVLLRFVAVFQAAMRDVDLLVDGGDLEQASARSQCHLRTSRKCGLFSGEQLFVTTNGRRLRSATAQSAHVAQKSPQERTRLAAAHIATRL